MMGRLQFTGSIKRVIKAFVENDAVVQYLAGEMASFRSFHGPIYTQKSFFEQYLPRKIQSVNKVTFFKAIAHGRKVLHVGCCDWPIMDIKSGLHKQLSEVAGELVGSDTATGDLKKMQAALPNFRFIKVRRHWVAALD